MACGPCLSPTHGISDLSLKSDTTYGRAPGRQLVGELVRHRARARVNSLDAARWRPMKLPGESIYEGAQDPSPMQ